MSSVSRATVGPYSAFIGRLVWFQWCETHPLGGIEVGLLLGCGAGGRCLPGTSSGRTGFPVGHSWEARAGPWGLVVASGHLLLQCQPLGPGSADLLPLARRTAPQEDTSQGGRERGACCRLPQAALRVARSAWFPSSFGHGLSCSFSRSCGPRRRSPALRPSC